MQLTSRDDSNRTLDAAISEAARTISFGEILLARGEVTVALDENGTLMRYFPDGTSEPVASAASD